MEQNREDIITIPNIRAINPHKTIKQNSEICELTSCNASSINIFLYFNLLSQS